MKRSLSGRAELICALASGDAALTASMVDLLGYHETQVVRPEPVRVPPETGTRPWTGASELDAPYEPVDVPFWRLEAYEAVSLGESPPERSTRIPTDPDWRHRPTALPDFAPLAPQQVVLTRLRQVSATRRATHDIDEEAVVERLSRGGLIDPIPHRQRRLWGSEIYIIKDRAWRLAPYWLDQDDVIGLLQRLYPPSGVTIDRIGDGEQHPVIQSPNERYGEDVAPLPGTMVLVLGDLGCLASQGDDLRRFWLQWGRQLHDNQNPAVALVPAQSQDIPLELARTWTVVRWDAASGVFTALPPQSAVTTVQRLLTLLSPAVRVEPGLLRAVRCLLPEGRRAPGLEARIWQDEAVASPHSRGATLDPELRKVYRSRFADQPRELRRSVLSLVRAWRADLHAAVWFEEVVGLGSQSRRELIADADWEDAVTFLRTFADTQRQPGQLSADTAAWIQRVAGRLSEAAPPVRQVLHDLYDLVRPHAAATDVPAWYDPAVVSPAGQTVRQVALWQVADQLLLQVDDPVSSTGQGSVMRGSPLGVVQTASGEVKIDVSQRAWPADDFWEMGQPPAWAQRWGWDAFGPWVTFRIDDVEQRMRWIPAGRFYMGSPDDEAGRHDDEGPRHEVQLTQGFWLFDTPCTQALWRAVMGTNPSHFQGEKRPVENVSWEDCQAFVTALKARLLGLDLRLPTEAQWEYACRAGTETVRYQEDVDAIAWYAENSNDETHEVSQKLPNAWGLYDMLGNVDEWCHDGRRDYEAGMVIDPVGSIEAGAGRAVRGGDWFVSARVVRAASRLRVSPGLRRGLLGFRCSSSGGSEPARARTTWRESERKAERAATAIRRSAARLLNVQRQSSLLTKLPDADGFVVSTDRDRLYFGRIIKPLWATEIGRDAYGLWVMLEVGGVRQRLRWIPPGRFYMGSPDDEEGRYADEEPRHEVQLSRGFWLFDTPCTQALWQAVMGENPSEFQGGNRPVGNVSWEDCQAFISRLNQCFEGLALGLPTEAQWEYACRAGTKTARYQADLDAIAWYDANSNDETHDIGQKLPNTWGLYDMLGNVLEWCHDGERDYEAGVVIDPVGPTEAGAVRAVRGGHWFGSARFVRAAYRLWLRPGLRGAYLGFRCSSSGVG